MQTHLSLGSNVGNRLLNLQQAVSLIVRRGLMECLQCSLVLETDAILPENAPATWNTPYLNMVVAGNCTLDPNALLETLKAIELELGRDLTAPRWSPRVIDIDILLVEGKTIALPELKIPHHELHNRPFLLHLLALLDPAFKSAPATRFNKALVLEPKLVGIVNITPDSFSDGGKYLQPEKAILKALELHSDGASIIELGAQSTRPSASLIAPEDEYNLLEPVLDGLNNQIRHQNLQISIDSFSKDVIIKILENHKVAWINDQACMLDNQTLALIAEAGCKIVVMHALTIPAKREVQMPPDADATQAINDWSMRTVEKLLACGFTTESIILDPGIGFGKSAYQSLNILKNIARLQKFGCEMLIGHSRKSYLTSFCNLEPAERDLETIAISEHLANCGIEYLRVHDVLGHQRFFVGRKVMALT